MLRITQHACNRFQQRVRTCDQPKTEIANCIISAKPKHIRKAQEKSTYYVPLGCCMLVCEYGVIVTILEQYHTDPLPKGSTVSYRHLPKVRKCERCGAITRGYEARMLHKLDCPGQRVS